MAAQRTRADASTKSAGGARGKGAAQPPPAPPRAEPGGPEAAKRTRQGGPGGGRAGRREGAEAGKGDQSAATEARSQRRPGAATTGPSERRRSRKARAAPEAGEGAGRQRRTRPSGGAGGLARGPPPPIGGAAQRRAGGARRSDRATARALCAGARGRGARKKAGGPPNGRSEGRSDPRPAPHYLCPGWESRGPARGAAPGPRRCPRDGAPAVPPRRGTAMLGWCGCEAAASALPHRAGGLRTRLEPCIGAERLCPDTPAPGRPRRSGAARGQWRDRCRG